jgi:hypothetical protein
MKDALRIHVGTRPTVTITRRTPCGQRLHGYLLDLSETLGLIHVFADFDPYGYVVFRVQDVVEVRSGPHELWWHHMLSAENLLGGLDSPPHLDLSSMRSAIESIARHCAHMIIECEDDDEDVEDFYIGSRIRTEHDKVVFRHFDDLGCWSRKAAAIAIDDITKVQFETPYIKVFSKYTRERG